MYRRQTIQLEFVLSRRLLVTMASPLGRVQLDHHDAGFDGKNPSVSGILQKLSVQVTNSANLIPSIRPSAELSRAYFLERMYVIPRRLCLGCFPAS